MHPVYSYGVTRDESYQENLMELRWYKPYLKKQLEYFRMTEKNLQFPDDVEEMKLFLDVIELPNPAKKVGMDGVGSYLRKIQEMYRKHSPPSDQEWKDLCMQHNRNPNDYHDETAVVSGDMKLNFERRERNQPMFQNPRFQNPSRSSTHRPIINNSTQPEFHGNQPGLYHTGIIRYHGPVLNPIPTSSRQEREQSWLPDSGVPLVEDLTKPDYRYHVMNQQPTLMVPARPPVCIPNFSNVYITAPQAPPGLASMYPQINIQAYQNPYYGSAHYPIMMSPLPPQAYNFAYPHNVSGHSQLSNAGLQQAPHAMVRAPHYNASIPNLETIFQPEYQSADYFSHTETVTQQRASPSHRTARKPSFNRDRSFNQMRINAHQVKRINMAELEETKPNTNTRFAQLRQRQKLIRLGQNKKVVKPVTVKSEVINSYSEDEGETSQSSFKLQAFAEALKATIGMSRQEEVSLLNDKNELKKFCDKIRANMERRNKKKSKRNSVPKGAVQREPIKKGGCTRREAHDTLAGFSSEGETESLGSGVSTTSASRRDPTRKPAASSSGSCRPVQTARKSTGGTKNQSSVPLMLRKPERKRARIVKTSESEGEEAKAQSNSERASREPRNKDGWQVVKSNHLRVSHTHGLPRNEIVSIKVEPEEEVKVVYVKEELDLVDSNPEDDYEDLFQVEIKPGASTDTETEVRSAESGDQKM